MRRLLFQAVFLIMGMVVGVHAYGDVESDLICAALVTVCCAAVSEYAGASYLTAAMLAMFDCVACFAPSWCLMLSIVAFNAALLPGVVESPVLGSSRWLWLVPAIALPMHSAVPTIAIAMATLMAALGFFVGALCARDARFADEVRRLQDSRRDQIRRLRSQLAENDEDRASAVRTATLAERTRIAREIHDNVGHMLTRAIMQAEAAQVVAHVAGQERMARQFAEIHDTVDETMTLVRKAVHDLKDEGTDFVSQIAVAAHSMDAAGKLRVTLSNGIDKAPAAVARCFATAIREALNNTVRHSQASNVSITLHDFPALWQLCVQDDGARWNSTIEISIMRLIRASDRTGIGISDIEERARALNGFAVCGPYHEGWRVFVSIPKPVEGKESHTKHIHGKELADACGDR